LAKYLFIVFTIMLLALGAFHAYFYMGVFIDFRPNAPIEVVFRAGDDRIYKDDAPLLLRGVELVDFVPDQSYWELGATKEDYLRWFEQIAQMGSTVIYVADLLHSDFYNAFYEFNTNSDYQILLIQGVHGVYREDLTASMRRAIDIVNGRRFDLFNQHGIQIFLNNISPWVIGYVVGSDWNPDDIAYINHNVNFPEYFEGEFFSTAENANRFEAMLAQIMDDATTYERRRFKTQRPMTFLSNPFIDFLEYETIYAAQLRKYVQLDHNHIIPSEKNEAGIFAAYRIFYFVDDFLSHITDAQRERLAHILVDLDTSCDFNGYLDLVARHHTMPVIAVSFAASSGRAPNRINTTALTEREQGLVLLSTSRQLEERNWAGVLISTWQDHWERRTWNTAFATNNWRDMYWNNIQSLSGNYGLMAFDPGSEQRPVYIDGNDSEWDESHFVHEYDGIRIYTNQSHQSFYMLIRGEHVNPRDTLYIPIKVTPNSGTRMHNYFMFEQPADFLLRLNGTQNTRLLVNMRYNATFMRFHEEKTGENPFFFIPDQWEAEFVPIMIALQNTNMYSEGELETLAQRRLRSWETGRLVHGINNPHHPSFNSLADFCFGDGFVEIRIPWMMLNFFDPSTMEVHDDFFEVFGVEGLPIEHLYIGVAHQYSHDIPMSPAPLQHFRRNLEFHERLKTSYYIMQEAWTRTDD